ncbi:MAG TPA: GreA/GreB family elongation factor [Lacunisphaera sp.]|nr:GreA/GreB family elongation factor [Lacunisphaera sp.]
MNPIPFYITREDHALVRLLLNAAHRSGATPALERLRSELDHATLLDSAAIPPDVVTLGACVQFEDLYSGEIEEYTLTLPDQADIAAGRLSVLAPVGTALLGYREGCIVEWPTPGGIRRLKIHRVTPRDTVSAGDTAAVAYIPWR